MKNTIFFILLLITTLISFTYALASPICDPTTNARVTLDSNEVVDLQGSVEEITCEIRLNNGANLVFKNGNVKLAGGRVTQSGTGGSVLSVEGSLAIVNEFTNANNVALPSLAGVKVQVSEDFLNCIDAEVSSDVYFNGRNKRQLWKGSLSTVYIQNDLVTLTSSSSPLPFQGFKCPSSRRQKKIFTPSTFVTAERIYLGGNTLQLLANLKFTERAAIYGTALKENIISQTVISNPKIIVESNTLVIETEDGASEEAAIVTVKVPIEVLASGPSRAVSNGKLRLNSADVLVTEDVVIKGELEMGNLRTLTIEGDLTITSTGSANSGNIVLKGDFANEGIAAGFTSSLTFKGDSRQNWSGSVSGSVFLDNAKVSLNCDSPIDVAELNQLYLRGNTLDFSCELRFNQNNGGVYGKAGTDSVLFPRLPLNYFTNPKVVIAPAGNSKQFFVRTEGEGESVVTIKANVEVEAGFGLRVGSADLLVTGDITVNGELTTSGQRKTIVEGTLTVATGGSVTGGEVVAKGDVFGNVDSILVPAGRKTKQLEGDFKEVRLDEDQTISTPPSSKKRVVAPTTIERLLLNCNSLTLASGELAVTTRLNGAGTIDNSGTLVLGTSSTRFPVLNKVTVNNLDKSDLSQTGILQVPGDVAGNTLTVIGCITAGTDATGDITRVFNPECTSK